MGTSKLATTLCEQLTKVQIFVPFSTMENLKARLQYSQRVCVRVRYFYRWMRFNAISFMIVMKFHRSTVPYKESKWSNFWPINCVIHIRRISPTNTNVEIFISFFIRWKFWSQHSLHCTHATTMDGHRNRIHWHGRAMNGWILWSDKRNEFVSIFSQNLQFYFATALRTDDHDELFRCGLCIRWVRSVDVYRVRGRRVYTRENHWSPNCLRCSCSSEVMTMMMAQHNIWRRRIWSFG